MSTVFICSTVSITRCDLRDPGLYQLPHQGGRSGIIRLKTDGAFFSVMFMLR